MTKIEKGEKIAELKQLDEVQLAALVAGSSENKSIYQEIGYSAGVVDSPLKLLNKLETKDIIMIPLHIDKVHISAAVMEGGVYSQYPLLHFEELPECYYQGGGRISTIVAAWAQSAGDKISLDAENQIGEVADRTLPKLNKFIEENGSPWVVFKWKDGRKNKYVDVIVLGA